MVAAYNLVVLKGRERLKRAGCSRIYKQKIVGRLGGSVADRLVVKGAREHNLKGVDIDLPRDKMIAFTGLSGSGKSSLAFDTIFAEGQRLYV